MFLLRSRRTGELPTRDTAWERWASGRSPQSSLKARLLSPRKGGMLFIVSPETRQFAAAYTHASNSYSDWGESIGVVIRRSHNDLEPLGTSSHWETAPLLSRRDIVDPLDREANCR